MKTSVIGTVFPPPFSALNMKPTEIYVFPLMPADKVVPNRNSKNYLQIPVNRAVVEVNNSQRDGSMQLGEYSGPVNYEPASIAGGPPVEAPSGTPPVYRVEGEVTKKKISRTNDFQQAGNKYRFLSQMDREHLVGNLIADLMPIDKQIQQRVITNLSKADVELVDSWLKALNFKFDEETPERC